jgi:hypothetical protein
MDDFSDYLCSVCGEPIGLEPYFAAFGHRSARPDPELLWPEAVFHDRCMTDYIAAKRRRGEPT